MTTRVFRPALALTLSLLSVAVVVQTADAQTGARRNPRRQRQAPPQPAAERQCDVPHTAVSPGASAADFYRSGMAQFLNPRAAIGFFNQAIEASRNSAIGYRGRAWASLANRCNNRAREDFDRVLALEPDDSEAYRGRAWANLLEGKYGPAASDFSEAIRRARNPAEAYTGLALAQYFAGDSTEARKNFRAGMAFRPGFNDAVIYTRSGEFIMAPAEELRDLSTFSPQARLRFSMDPRLRADVSTRLDDWGRYQKVQAILRQRLQRSPQNADAWLAMAVTSYRQLDDEPGNQVTGTARREARSSIERAVAAEPDASDIRMVRGMLSATPETADPEGAVADFSAVIERNSTDSDAYLRRAMILAVVNRFDQAIGDCKTAQTLDPDNPAIPRLCQELSVRRAQFERLMQARARYAQRYQEMESIAWIALAAIIGGFYAGGAPLLPPL